jgi:hypothetical protein
MLLFLAACVVMGPGTGMTEPTAYAQEGAATVRKLLYYNPDSDYQVLIEMVSSFNQFLRSSGVNVEFQAVSRSAVLEDQLSNTTSWYAIVSSAYLKDAKNRKDVPGLEPLMVPSLYGKTHFSKLLVTTSAGQSAQGSWRGKRIAAAATDSDPKRAVQAIVRTLKDNGINTDGAVVVPVSKDIDALLSLSFGQADAALVAPSSLEVLKRIQRTAAERTKIIATTKPSLYPPFCSVAGRPGAADVQAMVTLLEKMSRDPAGKQVLRALGFDQWVPYRASMLTTGGE